MLALILIGFGAVCVVTIMVLQSDEIDRLRDRLARYERPGQLPKGPEEPSR